MRRRKLLVTMAGRAVVAADGVVVLWPQSDRDLLWRLKRQWHRWFPLIGDCMRLRTLLVAFAVRAELVARLLRSSTHAAVRHATRSNPCRSGHGA
jgi:hypothetical protein